MSKPGPDDNRFKYIFKKTVYGYFEHDIEGKITCANENLCKITGYSEEELIGTDFNTFLDEEEKKKVDKDLKRKTAGTEPSLAYYAFRTKNGTMKHVEVMSLPLEEGGKTKGFFGTVRDITSQQRMEKKLQESEDKYRSIFENIMDVYYRSDMDGNLVMVSPSGKDLLGYSNLEEMIGKNIAETFYYNPEDRETFIAELSKTGQVKNYEVILRHKNGYPIYIETHSRILYDSEGNPSGVEGVIRDITEHRKADQALKESEEKYKTLVEASPNGIVMTDLEGVILYVSPKACAMYGADSEDDLVGVKAFDLIAPEYREEAGKNLEKTLQNGTSKNIEYVLQKKDGTTYYAEMSSAVIRNADGSPAAFMGILEDISSRKETEEAFRESEQKYKRLFEHSNDAIFISYLDGTIIDVNRSACAMLDYTYDELMDIPVYDLHPEQELETSRQAMKEIQENQMVRFDTLLQRSDGKQVDVEISARIVDDDKGIIEGIVHDISRRKQAEQERRELEARLHRARKMEALGALASGVAHDLNNMLWGLVSYPDIILANLPEDDPLREHVVMIQKSGEKAVSIVQDLLALARRGVKANEVLSINDVITDYLESPEYLDLKEQHHEIKWDISFEKELSNIVGSPLNIRKTVMNLIINAIEAMKGEGTISVSTSCITVEEPIKGYEEIPPGQYAVVQVSDEGEGISSENMERIFEPFFTTKVMERSGTGLGMAVVWSTVKDHNGYIDVESGDGCGARFSLYFPVTRKEKGEDGRDRSYELEKLQGNGETILIVDDLPEQRELLSLMLSRLGYLPETAGSGEEAVEFMKNHSADLLIIDMFMNPGMNGLEAFREIRKIHPGQKAVIGTGMNDAEEVREAHELGIRTCLSKPYRLKTLGAAVCDELIRDYPG